MWRCLLSWYSPRFVRTAAAPCVFSTSRAIDWTTVKGSEVEFVVGGRSGERVDVSPRDGHNVHVPVGPRVVIGQHALVVVDQAQLVGVRDRNVAVEV